MLNSLKVNILRNLSNIPGWRTRRRLVVFESDDWGSIRMPSVEVFEKLSHSGIDMTSDEGYRFNKYDSLETAEDLTSLFDILSGTKDSTGRPAVFTPVSVVSNPDFEKIMHSGFSGYFYEPFVKTLEKYPGCDNSYALWKEGIAKRLFMPQFHGREHLNVKAWMSALKGNHRNTLETFKYGMWGISTNNDPDIGIELQAAFDFIDPGDLTYQEEVIATGLALFRELFGYRATFFVPPNGPFSSKLESVCIRNGIKYLSTSKIQLEPVGHKKTVKKLHRLGQKSNSGITYLTRNCFFEPSQSGQNWIERCLAETANAFKWHKPAVISTHRVNYIGALHRVNREKGLSELSLLLKEIMKNWPETEFITSHELGEIITGD